MKFDRPNNKQRILLLLMLLVAFTAILSGQTTGSIRIDLDATEAARNVLHVHEKIEVKPGEFALFYPKWIPGEHAPTGTLNEMMNFTITAGGKPIEWTRDDVEMFAFRLTVPAGVNQIDVVFDDNSQPGTVASAQLSRIKWNRLLLYPRGIEIGRASCRERVEVWEVGGVFKER